MNIMCATRTPTKYGLTLLLNGETYRKRTNDIDAALQELKPDMVLTETYVIVKEGKNVTERKLNLVQARKVFTDAVHREIFINNLLLS